MDPSVVEKVKAVFLSHLIKITEKKYFIGKLNAETGNSLDEWGTKLSRDKRLIYLMRMGSGWL